MIGLLIGIVVSTFITYVTYKHIGISKVKHCYALWLDPKYWTSYNIVEAISWGAKAAIIIPGLIFGIHIWWLYFISLFTSIALIWVSNTKLIPTLVGFNTLWIFISTIVLINHII